MIGVTPKVTCVVSFDGELGMNKLAINLLSAAGFLGGLWALSHVDDNTARLVVLYTSFCALVAPILFWEYARR